jgi:hypothetical protein
MLPANHRLKDPDTSVLQMTIFVAVLSVQIICDSRNWVTLTFKLKLLLKRLQFLFPSSGRVTVYLGKRDFIDNGDQVDPIDGVVVVDTDYLKGRKVYGRVTTTYRYGREEDEVMGLKFSKQLVLAQQQIVPSEDTATELTTMQVPTAFARKK